MISHQDFQIFKVRHLYLEVGPNGRLALLPAVGILSYLRRLQRADFNVFHPELQTRNNWLAPALWWAKICKKL